MNTIYKDSINQLFESVIWTHKIQRTYLEVLSLRRKILAIVKLCISSFTSISTVVSSFFDNKTLTMIFAIATVVSVILNEILDKVETKENIIKFENSSQKLWEIKEKMLKFADEIRGSSLSEKEISLKLEHFQELFSMANSGLKTVPNYIVNKAAKKIKVRKDEEVEMKLI